VPLDKIYHVTYSQKVLTLCGIYVKNQYDIVLETHRRGEIIAFLLQIYKYRKLRPFICAYTDGDISKSVVKANIAKRTFFSVYRKAKKVLHSAPHRH
jgi:hypothetical protein